MIPAICIASGPSLTKEDVEFCFQMGKVYVVNDCHKLAPWADVLYSGDREWWQYYNGVPEFKGDKYTCDPHAANAFGINLVNLMHHEAFYLGDNTIASGKNSGFQAMNLAALHGYTKIILLGYDMSASADGRRHWFGDHPNKIIRNSNYNDWLKHFRIAAPLIKSLGIDVINCTTDSAIDCFPKMPLKDALC